MIIQTQPGTCAALCAALLALTSGCAGTQTVARPQPPRIAQPVAQAAAEPAAAKDILMRMAQFLSKTPKFSVNLQGSYDVLQDSGQKIEFGEARKITISRPNGLRVEVEHSHGEKHVVLYDGKDITAFTPTQNVYAQIPIAGGIDTAITYFLKDLHMRLPLAALLLSRLPEELERRTQSLAYVERTLIQGTPSHHLAGRTETVDYQVWVAEGAQPLPLRVVLTYKSADGQPEFRAQFSDWNLTPVIQDALFTFTPPEQARKISFVAQLPQIELEGAPSPKQTGGKP